MQKNLWLFMILSITILIGWGWLMESLFPPPPRPPQPPAQVQHTSPDTKQPAPTPLLDSQAAAALVAALAGPASQLGHAFHAAATTLGNEEFNRHLLEWKKGPALKTMPHLAEFAAYLTPDPLAVGLRIVAQTGKFPAPSLTEKIEVVTIGGDARSGFHMEVDFTTLGGGVRKLRLNKFQEADRWGRPVFKKLPTGDVQEAPLDLIPDDREMASFLLYHYPHHEAEHPYTTLGERNWTLEEVSRGENEHTVRFRTHVPGMEHLVLRRIFTLKKGTYHLGMTLEIHDTRQRTGENDTRTTFRYQLAGAHGLPIEGDWYTYTYRNAIIGMVDSRGGLWRELEDSYHISLRQGGDRVPQGGRGQSFLQYAGVGTQYFASVIAVDPQQPAAGQGGVDRKDILAYARPTQETEEHRYRLDDIRKNQAQVLATLWDSRMQERLHLLPRALADLEEEGIKPGDLVYASTYITRGRTVVTRFRKSHYPRPQTDDITVRVISEPVELLPGQKRVHKFLLYHGPVKVRQLDQFSSDKTVHADLVNLYADDLYLRTLTDYRSPGPIGWISQFFLCTDIFIFFTKLMHWLLYWLKFLVFGNEGLSIILLTVVVRGLMFPISRKQTLMTMKMQELSPELKKLQEKYKDDQRALHAATMELYRKHHVNPFGCGLTFALQLPVFLGLYYALQESISFRLAPFLWMENLAAPDMLFYWGQGFPPFTDLDVTLAPAFVGGLPYYGMLALFYLGPYFNLLPILAIGLMFLQQKLTMPPPRDDIERQNYRTMKFTMILFGILFYKVSSGLTLYFIATTLWGLAERQMLPKKKPVTEGEPARLATLPSSTPSASPPPMKRSRRKGRGKKGDEPKKPFQKVQDWWNEILKQAKKK